MKRFMFFVGVALGVALLLPTIVNGESPPLFGLENQECVGGQCVMPIVRSEPPTFGVANVVTRQRSRIVQRSLPVVRNTVPQQACAPTVQACCTTPISTHVPVASTVMVPVTVWVPQQVETASQCGVSESRRLFWRVRKFRLRRVSACN